MLGKHVERCRISRKPKQKEFLWNYVLKIFNL